ncbi:hypothetical protein DM02DRAFT_575070 [Periconia macrospinosa]|uniref:Carboxymuconolactone decarboxylase-like domain-containing protein n=1 Tax=Periconia macrospinosa TaxID=97972 RepID=A0A2V1D6R9_9PLEO|nr:hypothetical protein DM02DRAFT_575070 [Periconia macrospinosa]
MSDNIAPRYPLVSPGALTALQRPIHDHITAVSTAAFGLNAPFEWRDRNGALLGPFTMLLYTPSIGTGFFDHVMTVMKDEGLPKRVKELVIVAVAAHYGSVYEIKAHTNLALLTGLSEKQIEQVIADIEPDGLDDAERAAYRFAVQILRSRGPVPVEAWDSALAHWGQERVATLVYLVGSYSYVSMVLNAAAVGYPDDSSA